MKMKLVYHSNFDVFTLKGVAVAVFISLYALVLTVYPDFDPIITLVFSSIASIGVWQILIIVIIQRHGLCVEFKYSKQGSGRSRMDLWYSHEVQNSNVVKLVVDANSHALYFSRSPIPFVRDKTDAEWPLQAFYRHVGIYAYRLLELKQLSSTPPCGLEQLEKLEQLRALWLGIPIAMMHWQGPLHAGIDAEDDVARVVAVMQAAEAP